MKKVELSTTVDDEMLERLVDGQLSGDRYRAVLRALDESSDGWRKCAIAFLQEQALTQELRSLSHSGFRLNSEAPATESGRGMSSESPRLAQPEIVQSHGSMWRLAGILNALSLAACLLVAFTVGWFGAGMRDSRSDGIGSRGGSPAHMANMASSPGESGSGQSRLDPTIVDTTRFVLDSQEAFVPIDRRVPQQLLELERLGMVQIETIDGIVPFKLEDGRAAVIPVQNFRVKPVWFAY